MILRPDETWHCLLNWNSGSTLSERLAGQILQDQGYEDYDPIHPLGGPDGGKDALCRKNGKNWIVAVYFPRGPKTFKVIKDKFRLDFAGVEKNQVDGIIFVTNQILTEGERKELKFLGKSALVEIYHLERLVAVMDQSRMTSTRKQYLGIDTEQASDVEAGNASAGQSSEKLAWVLHCSDESIAAGQVSLFAIAEILLAVGLYWWLVTHFDWPWMAFVGMIAAPMLLLRSQESIVLGVRLLQKYWRPEQTFETLYERLIVAAPGFLLIAVIIWLINMKFLDGKSPFSVLNIVFALLFISMFVRAAIKAIVLVGVLTVMFCSFGALYILLLEFLKYLFNIHQNSIEFILSMIPFLLVAVTISVVFAKELANAVERKVLGDIEAGLFLNHFGSFFVFDIFLKGLLIRLFSVLRHPLVGFAQLPNNWREAMWVIDFYHQPELLPQANRVDTLLTANGLWGKLRTQPENERVLWITMLVAWYVPAFAYRMSLKASFWFWFPLILALKQPLKDHDPEDSRDAMARITPWHLWCILITAIIMVWLFSASPILQTLYGVLPDWWHQLAIHFPAAPPVGGIRYLFGQLTCALSILFIIAAINFKASHGEVMRSSNEFENLKPKNKAKFLTTAKGIDRIRWLLIAAILFWGETMALGFLYERYPVAVERFVSSWSVAPSWILRNL